MTPLTVKLLLFMNEFGLYLDSKKKISSKVFMNFLFMSSKQETYSEFSLVTSSPHHLFYLKSNMLETSLPFLSWRFPWLNWHVLRKSFRTLYFSVHLLHLPPRVSVLTFVFVSDLNLLVTVFPISCLPTPNVFVDFFPFPKRSVQVSVWHLFPPGSSNGSLLPCYLSTVLSNGLIVN